MYGISQSIPFPVEVLSPLTHGYIKPQQLLAVRRQAQMVLESAIAIAITQLATTPPRATVSSLAIKVSFPFENTY